MWLVWLVTAIVLGIVEMLTVDLIFLMLAGGAAAGTLVALAGAPIWVQAVVAALVALTLLVVVRPWVKEMLQRSTPDTPMNVRALVGQIAQTLSEVTDRDGRVKLNGEVWSARTAADVLPRPEGEDVRVVEIDGAFAVVAPLEVVGDPYGTVPPSQSWNPTAFGPGGQAPPQYGPGAPGRPAR